MRIDRAAAGRSGVRGVGAVLLLAAAIGAAGKGKTTVWSFESEALGVTPKGFDVGIGEWVVVESKDAGKVLAQTAENPDDVFNVVLASEPKAKDFTLSVKLKAIAGVNDQGGGLVWRAKDAKNYYIARFNPIEDNFRVYKVVDGTRTMFKTSDVKRAEGWHTLKVTMKGKRLTCTLDDKVTMEVDDETFTEAGQVGLWSKSDARSQFTGLTLTSFDD